MKFIERFIIAPAKAITATAYNIISTPFDVILYTATLAERWYSLTSGQNIFSRLGWGFLGAMAGLGFGIYHSLAFEYHIGKKLVSRLAGTPDAANVDPLASWTGFDTGYPAKSLWAVAFREYPHPEPKRVVEQPKKTTKHVRTADASGDRTVFANPSDRTSAASILARNARLSTYSSGGRSYPLRLN